MVRRWSYINQINRISSSEFQSSSDAAFDSVVNSHMYLRKSFNSSTTITRRKWARRRHLSNWLSISNVMSNWSSSYLFNRRLLKALHAQLLTKHSFIVLSVLSFKNSIPSLHKNTESVISSTLTRSLFNYFQRYNSSRLMFFKSLKNINVTFLSLTSKPKKGFDVSNLKSSSAFVPMLLDAGESFSSIELNSTKIRTIYTHHILQSIILKQHLAVFTSVRKSLILLTVNTIN